LSSAASSPIPAGEGTWISSTIKVMAIAKSPSLRASIRVTLRPAMSL
jgi:hypothetical protein